MQINSVFYGIQRRNHVFNVGVKFLVSGYYYPSTEKNRQVYPVWSSRFHNNTLDIKKLCKSWGSVQILGRSGPPSLVVAPTTAYKSSML